jgi:hypothetical protein
VADHAYLYRLCGRLPKAKGYGFIKSEIGVNEDGDLCFVGEKVIQDWEFIPATTVG